MVIANRMAAALRRPMAHQFPATPALIRLGPRASPTLPEIIGVALDPGTPHRRRWSDVFASVTLGEIDRALAIGEAQSIERGERVPGGRPPHQRLHFLAVPGLDLTASAKISIPRSIFLRAAVPNRTSFAAIAM